MVHSLNETLDGNENQTVAVGNNIDYCCSVTKSCLTLHDPMDCSRPGSFVLHYLSEFAQIYIY